MNGFLVLLVRNLGDEPLRLFATREEAHAFARQVNVVDEPMPADGLDGVRRVRPHTIGVAVLPFVDGVPQPFDKVDLPPLPERATVLEPEDMPRQEAESPEVRRSPRKKPSSRTAASPRDRPPA